MLKKLAFFQPWSARVVVVSHHLVKTFLLGIGRPIGLEYKNAYCIRSGSQSCTHESRMSFFFCTSLFLLYFLITLLLGTWKLRINWSRSHNKYVQWQHWNSCTGNKIRLQAIRPTVGGHQPISSLSRRDVVVVNRLRIGHTRCTHSYLLTGAEQPDSTTCQCPLTVTAKHILAVVELQHNL